MTVLHVLCAPPLLWRVALNQSELIPFVDSIEHDAYALLKRTLGLGPAGACVVEGQNRIGEREIDFVDLVCLRGHFWL